MSTNKEFVEFIIDQINYPGQLTFKSMFGEYGVWADGKIFGLICDNKLFIKPTEAGRLFLKNPVEAPPYNGAKPSFLIGDKIEDSEWLSELVSLTVKELPEPRPKQKKKSKH